MRTTASGTVADVDLAPAEMRNPRVGLRRTLREPERSTPTALRGASRVAALIANDPSRLIEEFFGLWFGFWIVRDAVLPPSAIEHRYQFRMPYQTH